MLRQSVFKVSADKRFDTIVNFLRRRLGLDGNDDERGKGIRKGESVFCYVNSVFAPGMDEGVGNLWRVSY